jgi:hypothetical protein
MEKYIEQCRKLSLTARLSVALKIFERYCEVRDIESDLVSDFFNYLWEWPLIDGPDQFEPWVQSRVELVNYGLGDPANDEIEMLLAKHALDEEHFREIISGIVEILWGSFWGASEDELSVQALINVTNRCKVESLPILTPFKFSRFEENGGWGNKITEEDRDYWKNCA